jgi:hypothetical protein
MMHRSILIALFLGTWLACSDDSTSSGGGGPATTNGPDGGAPAEGGPRPGDGVTSSVVNAELEGTWNTPCVNEAKKWWGRTKLVIANGVATSEYFQYKDDPTCSDAAKLAIYWPTVTHSWRLDKAKKPVVLDKVLASSTIKVTDSELKGIWDQQSGCGPHALGVDEDIQGKTCWNRWYPAAGGTVYDIIEIYGPDAFALGAQQPGRVGQTPETRPTVVDARLLYTREGTTDGFIEATVDGQLVRADKAPSTPSASDEFIQISAATAATPPWKTWVLQIPTQTGTFTCKTSPVPTYINYGFTQDNLPVLWDTEQSGGNDCTITITKAATAPREVTEGTFSGVLGDGKAGGHNVTNGTFRIRRGQY